MDAHGRPALDAARLLDVLDGVPVLFYVQDPEGRITYANEAACALAGRPPEEVIGRLPSELFDPVTAERWLAQNAQLFRTGVPIDIEDGWGDRCHLTHKTPVFDADGLPVAVIGLSTDISERKRAEEAMRRSRERLAEAQQIAGVGSFHWDTLKQEVEWSQELRRILRFAPGSEPLGPETLDFVHADDRAELVEVARTALLEGGTFELDLRMTCGDGEERLVYVRAGATRAPDGTPLRIDGICEDVTERRPAEAGLAQAQRLAEIGSFDRDLEADEVRWSPETYRIFGVEPEHHVPSRPNVLAMVVDEDRERLQGEVERAIREDGAFDCFVTIRRADGELRHLRVRGAVHQVGAGPRHMIGIVQDLTHLLAHERARTAERRVLREMAAGRELAEALPAIEAILAAELDGEPVGEELATLISGWAARRQEEEQRLHDALHDPLTGLPNRMLFFDRLDHALRRQQREHAPLAVLFLDFDGFKAVNDRFGHTGGDQVLVEAAARVASTLRAEDTVARFGGDELVVLSEHIHGGREQAAGIAQRILERLREPIAVGGADVVLSASIGIAVAPVEGPTREALLEQADAAMYRAKTGGPGRYVIAE